MRNHFLVFISYTNYLDLIMKVHYTTFLLASIYFPLLTHIYSFLYPLFVKYYKHSDSLIKSQMHINISIYLICVSKYKIQTLSYNAYFFVRRCTDLFFQLCAKGINLQYKDIMVDKHLICHVTSLDH